MMRTQLVDQLVISTTRKTASNGIIRANQTDFSCKIGRSGIGIKNREGDGKTPIGSWRMLYFLFRADKIYKPRSSLPGFKISPCDSWCDLSISHRYNYPLARILPQSSEALWRGDNLYDIVVVLDHNTTPNVRGRGSAIFMHLRTKTSNYTQGCIALYQADLQKILRISGPNTKILIAQ